MASKSSNGSSEPTISKATPEDAPAITAMVNAAYSKYIERIGKPPAPMTTDYNDIILTHDVYMLRAGGDAVGSIVLHEVPSGSDPGSKVMKINNVVVDPSCQGRGYGRVLMQHAETLAKEKGLPAVELFTNVKMFENIGLYAKLGYTETGRRSEDGYDRVYFRKDLA